MIKAHFFKQKGNIRKFSISGHASYGEKGEDIVCAGVSACCEMTINAITEILKVPAKVVIDSNDTSIVCSLPDDFIHSSAFVFVESFLLELKVMNNNYPDAIELAVYEV